MRVFLVVLVLVLLTSIAAVATAEAKKDSAVGSQLSLRPPPPPMSQQEMLDYSLPIARSAVPGSGCAGRETVLLDQDAELLADHGFPVDGDGTVGDPCVVRVAHHPDVYAFCATLVHELYHLSGLEHEQMTPAMMRGDSDQCANRPPCPWPHGVCKKALLTVQALALAGWSRATLQPLRSGRWLIRAFRPGGVVMDRVRCRLVHGDECEAYGPKIPWSAWSDTPPADPVPDPADLSVRRAR